MVSWRLGVSPILVAEHAYWEALRDYFCGYRPNWLDINVGSSKNGQATLRISRMHQGAA
jgi:hypothetical protein